MDIPPADRAPHSGWYLIRIKGRLASRWAARFEPMSLTSGDDGTTVIEGLVVDQAALHGLLQQVRDTGLPLISVTQPGPHRTGPDRAGSDPTAGSAARPHDPS